MKAENRGNEGFLQRESVEHQGYAEARSTDRSEGKERDGASDLLEAILDRDNLNRAYKRVKSNHGAAGIDGMSVEEALPWLKEHREELLQSIRDGSYEPSPVRRKEIPKPDGGVRKLGIPTVVDRVIQQGIAQKLQNIWEPQFSDSSYGYRPKRSGQQAIEKVKKIRGRRIPVCGIGRLVQVFRYTEPRTAHESVAPEDTGHANTAHHQEVSEKRGNGKWCSKQNRRRFAAGRTAVTAAGEHLSQ